MYLHEVLGEKKRKIAKLELACLKILLHIVIDPLGMSFSFWRYRY